MFIPEIYKPTKVKLVKSPDILPCNTKNQISLIQRSSVPTLIEQSTNQIQNQYFYSFANNYLSTRL